MQACPAFLLVDHLRRVRTAHQHLYEDAGILHGNINNNTIIMLKRPDGSVEGALVDFDLPLSVAAQRKKYNPDPAVPPSGRSRDYYWRGPGV